MVASLFNRIGVVILLTYTFYPPQALVTKVNCYTTFHVDMSPFVSTVDGT